MTAAVVASRVTRLGRCSDHFTLAEQQESIATVYKLMSIRDQGCCPCATWSYRRTKHNLADLLTCKVDFKYVSNYNI